MYIISYWLPLHCVIVCKGRLLIESSFQDNNSDFISKHKNNYSKVEQTTLQINIKHL